MSSNSPNGSTAKWRRLRAAKLKACPVCELCHKEFAAEVDHIKPQRTHPHLRFEWSNLRSVGHDCHAERHGARIPARIDPKTGLPLPGQGARHWWST